MRSPEAIDSQTGKKVKILMNPSRISLSWMLASFTPISAKRVSLDQERVLFRERLKSMGGTGERGNVWLGHKLKKCVNGCFGTNSWEKVGLT